MDGVIIRNARAEKEQNIVGESSLVCVCGVFFVIWVFLDGRGF